MKSTRTDKQNRAMNINWSKARLMSAVAAITNATQILDKYEVVVDDVDYNLVRAKIALEFCLQAWDKQVWEKLNDEST